MLLHSSFKGDYRSWSDRSACICVHKITQKVSHTYTELSLTANTIFAALLWLNWDMSHHGSAQLSASGLWQVNKINFRFIAAKHRAKSPCVWIPTAGLLTGKGRRMLEGSQSTVFPLTCHKSLLCNNRSRTRSHCGRSRVKTETRTNQNVIKCSLKKVKIPNLVGKIK